MNAKTRQLILVVILVAACIWGYWNLFGKDQSRAASPPPQSAAPAASLIAEVPPQAANDSLVEPAEVKALYAEGWGADPFKWQAPAETTGGKQGSAPAKPEWRLSGIFFSANGPIAVVNDKLVKIGETVDQAEVVDINRKQVTLRVGGKERVLTLPNG